MYQVTCHASRLVGHHYEDWLSDDRDTLYLVYIRPGPAYLAITHGRWLPNVVSDQQGNAHFCDSVYPNYACIGVPRIFVSRAELPARIPADAIRSDHVNDRSPFAAALMRTNLLWSANKPSIPC
ncbi:MAG: hypothetical protein JSV81_20875 [Anaerolineales bacterium]|nr:MAG: hypothetical protein JSV81_20875 [Anaerolineales bacterium]